MRSPIDASNAIKAPAILFHPGAFELAADACSIQRLVVIYIETTNTVLGVVALSHKIHGTHTG